MSIESYIRALPKYELHLELEGAIPGQTLVSIAEQTDIPSTYKKPKIYREWVALLTQPDFNRLDEIVNETAAWLRHPEDIARVVYDVGVALSKQNVKYAEITTIPAIYTDLGMSFQDFMDAINDGADRLRRGWGVEIKWILAIPRDRPRKSDDIARWATSVTASRGNVVAMALVGREDSQPVAQFKKAFSTVEKRDVARVTHLLSWQSTDTFQEVIDTINPNRVTDTWGLLQNEQALNYLVENHIPVVVTPTRELRLGRIKSLSDYPLGQLLERGVMVTIGSGMLRFYATSLEDEYVNLNRAGIASPEVIEQLIRNAISGAFAEPQKRAAMAASFSADVEKLRAEHL
jgi:aminodeoxyfutalosine deaminase